jgi:hypothetical protein
VDSIVFFGAKLSKIEHIFTTYFEFVCSDDGVGHWFDSKVLLPWMFLTNCFVP